MKAYSSKYVSGCRETTSEYIGAPWQIIYIRAVKQDEAALRRRAIYLFAFWPAQQLKQFAKSRVKCLDSTRTVDGNQCK